MEPASSAVVKGVLGLVFDYLKGRLAQSVVDMSQDSERMRSRLETHLTEALAWSTTYQLLGMSKPAEIASNTIGLTLASEPRRFRGHMHSGHTQSEVDILTDQQHFMILGDPGSGKTTTIKRLVTRVLLEPPTAITDEFQYPVVVRLRELPPLQSLYVAVADAVGLEYVSHRVKVGPEEKVEVRIGDRAIEYAVPEFLTRTRAILFLDGLDEVAFDHRSMVKHQIQHLARRLNTAKVIVSCRSGDSSSFIEGFAIVEICPLSSKQIQQIATRWLGESDKFLHALARLPCSDAADRPLLLVNLLMLFKRQGYLPDQPANVYQRLVRLMLEDWDIERGIVRGSQYAGFTPDRKLSFLAALSYHLTYVKKAKVFNDSDLLDAYNAIRALFGLPATEARRVVDEIQSHTGIIVATATGFEFSHLSLQEYLCADYLVREPFAEHLPKYVAHYPGPLAIAISLASNSSVWFAALVLKPDAFSAFSPQSLHELLLRIRLERPVFTESVALGMALMRLFQFAEKSRMEQLVTDVEGLFRLEVAIPSLAGAMMFFQIVPRKSSPKLVWLDRRVGYLNQQGFATPESGALPKWALQEVVKSKEQSLVWEDSEGRLRDLRDFPAFIE